MELVLRDNEVRRLVFRNIRDEMVEVRLADGATLELTFQDYFRDDHIDLHRVVTTTFTGSHAQLRLVTRGLLRYSQQLTYELYTRHDADATISSHDVRYVVDDSARLDFTGKIYVPSTVHDIRAGLVNKNVLLSGSAVVHTEPQLEIYSQDVDVSHGAATGLLDQEALFYLQQRGFSERLARTILVKAFLR